MATDISQLHDFSRPRAAKSGNHGYEPQTVPVDFSTKIDFFQYMNINAALKECDEISREAERMWY